MSSHWTPDAVLAIGTISHARHVRPGSRVCVPFWADNRAAEAEENSRFIYRHVARASAQR